MNKSLIYFGVLFSVMRARKLVLEEFPPMKGLSIAKKTSVLWRERYDFLSQERLDNAVLKKLKRGKLV